MRYYKTKNQIRNEILQDEKSMQRCEIHYNDENDVLLTKNIVNMILKHRGERERKRKRERERRERERERKRERVCERDRDRDRERE